RTIPLISANNNLLATGQPGSNDRAHYLTGGDTWVISASKLNAFRAFGNIANGNKPGPSFFSPSDVGINAFSPGTTFITVNSGFSLGQAAFGTGYAHVSNAGVSDTLTLIKGAHQFSVGGHYLWTKTDLEIVTT